MNQEQPINLTTSPEQGKFPEQLHVTILKKLLLSQVRIPTWMFGLFIFNVILSGWHLIDRAVQKETLVFLQAFIEDFDVNFDFFHDAFALFFDYVPVKSAALFLINIVLLVALIRFSKKMKIALAIQS